MIINIRKSNTKEGDTYINFLYDNHCSEFMLSVGSDAVNTLAILLDKKHVGELYKKLRNYMESSTN